MKNVISLFGQQKPGEGMHFGIQKAIEDMGISKNSKFAIISFGETLNDPKYQHNNMTPLEMITLLETLKLSIFNKEMKG